MEFQRITNGGYNPNEVDEYIAKVSQNYTQLHAAYTAQQGEVERLMREAQTFKNDNARLILENGKLRQASVSQPLIDTGMIAKLMLDAELFAKQIKEQSTAEAEKRLADTQAQVQVLELQKDRIHSVIRQLASNLTSLTGGRYEDTFIGGNQPGIYGKPGSGQQSAFTAGPTAYTNSVPAGGYSFPEKSNTGV